MAKRTSSRRSSSERKPGSDAEIAKRVKARIRRASEFEDYEKILIYGRSGAGKTRVSASAPNVVIVDIDEKGTKSTLDIDPHAYRVQAVDEFVEMYWYLAAGNHSFETVAVDGVTGLSTLFLNFVLGEAAQLDASRDPDMPSRQIYGKVNKLMKNWLTNYKNLDMHVVFTALTRVNKEGGFDDDEDDDLGGAVTIGPAVSPGIATHLEAACDTIGYLHTRQVLVKKKGEEKRRKVTRRRLLTGPNERYDTKDRNNAFGEYVDNPNLTEMIARIGQARKEA